MTIIIIMIETKNGLRMDISTSSEIGDRFYEIFPHWPKIWMSMLFFERAFPRGRRFFCGHSLNLLIYWFRVWPRSIAWNLRDTRMIPYTHFLSDTQTNWKSTPISVQTGVLRSTRWIWKIFGWNLKYNKSNCAEQKRVRIFACTSICISVNSPPSYEQRTQLDRSIFWSVIMVMFFESTIQPLHRAFRHSLI